MPGTMTILSDMTSSTVYNGAPVIGGNFRLNPGSSCGCGATATCSCWDVGAWIANIQLRAERSGSGKGRAYTIDVQAFDSSNNVGQTSAVVIVPKGKGNRPGFVIT